MKSEIIIGLISISKSKISFNIFNEKKKNKPNQQLLDNQKNTLKELDKVLSNFYKELSISDDAYYKLIQQIKTYYQNEYK